MPDITKAHAANKARREAARAKEQRLTEAYEKDVYDCNGAERQLVTAGFNEVRVELVELEPEPIFTVELGHMTLAQLRNLVSRFSQRTQ